MLATSAGVIADPGGGVAHPSISVNPHAIPVGSADLDRVYEMT